MTQTFEPRIVEPSANYAQKIERAQSRPTFDPEHDVSNKRWTECMYFLDRVHASGENVQTVRTIMNIAYHLHIAAPRTFHSRCPSWMAETVQKSQKLLRTPDDLLEIGADIIQLNPELAARSDIRMNHRMIIDAMTEYRQYDPGAPDVTVQAIQLFPELRDSLLVQANVPFWLDIYQYMRELIHEEGPVNGPIEKMLRIGKVLRIVDPTKDEQVRLDYSEIEAAKFKGGLLMQNRQEEDFAALLANLSVVTADEVTITRQGQIVAKHFPRPRGQVN